MNGLFQNLPLLMGAPGGTAAGASGSSAQLVTTIITFGLVFVIFYFLIIRPQNKKSKETKQMLSALKKGDRVVTVGGVRGTITSIKEDTVILKVDGNTKIEFSRSAISGVVQQKQVPSKAKAIPEKEMAEDDTDEDSEGEPAEAEEAAAQDKE